MARNKLNGGIELRRLIRKGCEETQFEIPEFLS